MKYLFSSRFLSFTRKVTAISSLLLGLSCAAQAQAVKHDTLANSRPFCPNIPALTQAVKHDTLAQAKVYTQVEQMPQLIKANRRYTDREAVIRAIQRACRYPAEALRNGVQGTVLVGFTVNQQGEVQDVRVEKGLSADLDEATVAAVKALPRLRPGQQEDRPVAVR